ncbi:NADPH:quinone oxidoreductase family protein [Natrinema sp. 1APR25-10V2]|uniref:quinone oxidoreductase family protein n=1 Tax=Natrinema sp. 1APR25-10V2 TaxID=2951081 RepID=UPI002874D16B|nr:NADPH:quinone oxidoreductase family protein [Natrinema sp. 1APR25-10V2]MDS0477004.1 NADPH:quinone oxidoreductase family protein [Natrinema sp. 1APR25-10V2]
MNAIEVAEHGDSTVLKLVDKPIPEPELGEVRIRVEAAGINFADVMQRRGTYPGGPEPPYVPGAEAAGTVDAVGEGVDAEVGDRVVAMPGGGGYAEYVTASEELLFPVPDGMGFAEAAGFPVQFLTAHSCLFEWGELEEGESVLVQAAAGGVGTAAIQLASRADATVFGTASTDAKLNLAADLGCDHPINYTETDFRDVVDRETDGDGVDLVLESVGDDVFERSLDALAHFGRLVTYGVASGTPAAAENKRLLFENKSVRGFHLGQALARDPARITTAVSDLTVGFSSGDLEVIVGSDFALEDAAAAHRFIEERKSTGKVVLTP